MAIATPATREMAASSLDFAWRACERAIGSTATLRQATPTPTWVESKTPTACAYGLERAHNTAIRAATKRTTGVSSFLVVIKVLRMFVNPESKMDGGRKACAVELTIDLRSLCSCGAASI